jgi:predicted dehydrogenase
MGLGQGGVKVGFIGAGSVLWAYLQLLDRLVVRGLAQEGPICEPRADAWPGIIRARPHAQLVPHPEAVLTSDVEVVVVITPPGTHALYAKAAVEHGKHVLVEKPMASDRSEAEELVLFAAERRRWVVAAPFVHLSPSFRELWTAVREGAIGTIHSARALYGNSGSSWARWYHESGVGPLGDVGIYNIKSLTALLGPVREVVAREGVAVSPRIVEGTRIDNPDPDYQHVILRHAGGALSSIVASHAIQRYRRPAIELYGTEGTANLLGDDWAPSGLEIWRNESGRWETTEPVDETWLWTDGLRELVVAIHSDRPPLQELYQDLHVLDILHAARRSAQENRTISVQSGFPELDLTLSRPTVVVHDRTRPAEEQV